MLLNYHIGLFVLGSLCVGDLVRLGLSGVRVAGCWGFGAAGFEWCPCCTLQPATRTPLKPRQIMRSLHYYDVRPILRMAMQKRKDICVWLKHNEKKSQNFWKVPLAKQSNIFTHRYMNNRLTGFRLYETHKLMASYKREKNVALTSSSF